MNKPFRQIAVNATAKPMAYGNIQPKTSTGVTAISANRYARQDKHIIMSAAGPNGMSQNQEIPAMKATSSYLEFSKNAGQNNYLESLNTQTQTTNVENFSTVSASQTLQNDGLKEAINMSAAQDIAVKSNVLKTEEVSFKIDGAQTNQAVIADHFETVKEATPAKSLVAGSVQRTYGQLMLNMYASMKGLNKRDMAIPAFASIFMTLMLGVPTPAFAAVAATVAPAAPSAMVKLLKNVFCAGAAAVFTVTFIHPIDVVKTRIQVASANGQETGIGGVIGDAMKNEGAGAFYKGIGPAWLREASYTSLRLGLYEPVKLLVGASNPGAGFLRKFLAGAIAGAIGSCAGNPFDVLKTKMMADKDSDGKGLGEYAAEIKKAEGMMGFYKGFNTNVIRAMVLNATKMACYDSVKTYLVAAFALEGLLLQFCAAFTAGFFLTCTVSPFDKCRTLLMNQDSNNKEFDGLGGAFMSILKKEGPLGFYKGFIPIWSRFAPTTCLQLITFEQLKRLPFIALA